MGLMCWSPPLDKMGNSVKGIHFCHVSTIALGVFFSCLGFIFLGFGFFLLLQLMFTELQLA